MESGRQARAGHQARIAIAIAGLGLLIALSLAVGQASATFRNPLATTEERPSFVVIQTDDQTLDGLYAAYRTAEGGGLTRAMPNTLDLIAKRGMTFNRYYVSYPLCCPSRVSLLTGRYAHNHGDKGNIQPNGGYTGFAQRGAYTHNLAVWLQNSGYKTIHIGKFLNGYGDAPYDDGKTIPPGWSSWHTVLNADTDHFYYGYTENNNGVIEGPYGDSGSWDTREYGARDDPGCPFAPANGLPCYYETDHFTQQATEEISATPAGQPFYLQLDYTAPHGDFRRPAGPEPAPRHYNWFKGARLPHDRSEGFDEGNVSDKPRFIREAEHLTLNDKHTYRVYWQKQLEALRSVDDGVKQIVDTLGGYGRLRNTYILFTSDNGFFFGEHRLLGGKFLAYEPATHLPFLIRGPGIRPGTSTGELTANIDIAPTILELAGATADKSIDGRSMVPFIHDPTLRTRRPLLFESFVETSDVDQQGGAETQPGYEPAPNSGAALARPGAAPDEASASLLAPPKDYEGIRLGPYKYIAWPSGEKELYNINKDPNELNNLVKIPNYFPIRNYLHTLLTGGVDEEGGLEDCVGRTCSEPAAKIPLNRIELRRVRKQEREEKTQERREEREQREKERREKEQQQHGKHGK
jgi:N-acetylglucosamine-6-sulfatase